MWSISIAKDRRFAEEYSPGLWWNQPNKYRIRLSHIFEILSVSIDIFSNSIEIPGISIENLGFRSKHQVFRIRNLECQVFHTLNLKYWVFRAKYLYVFFISILKFKGQARICLRQHSLLARNMLMICLFCVKIVKWVQNVFFEAVVSFVSFEATVQRCSFKQVFLLSCQNP